MNNWVQVFRDFVYRDLLYIIGGSSVIISFCYLFNLAITLHLPSALYIFGAGLGYVIGYGLQDGLSFTRIISTRRVTRLWRFLPFLYERFTGDRWHNIEDTVKLDNAFRHLYTQNNVRIWNEYVRIISLRHIGTTMSASGLVSSFILLIKIIVSYTTLDFVLFLSAAGLSSLFWALGWIKGAQETTFVMRECENRNGPKITDSVRDGDSIPYEPSEPNH